ncbi:MAG TPA: GNAT family N-acetyltransferase [Patescibacteria group bacterium]|nr:GNAT family N-acetyltransferase [Patescibacteria group bacterium]
MGSFVVIHGESPEGIEALCERFADVTVFPAIGGYPPGDPAGAGFTVRTVRNGLVEGAFEAIGLPGGDGFSAALVWERLPWDTEVLGLPCARIHFLGGKDCVSLLAHWRDRAAGHGIRYVTFRIAGATGPDGGVPPCTVGARRAIESVHGCIENAGFTNIEQLVFVRGGTDRSDPPRAVEDPVREDVEDIVGIAQSSYTLDRFHREELFSPDVVKRFHRMRFLGSFGGRADKILVVRDESGRVAGYITCMMPGAEGARMGVLDMIAVRSDARRKGYARSLLFGALRYFHDNGFSEAGGGVHDQNHATRAMYAGLGFVEFSAVGTYRLTL